MKKKKKYENTERRKYLRIKYLNVEKPKLKIGKHKFEVLDISQRGLKFLNDKEITLSEYISGKLTFLYGESIAIEGSLAWEQDDDFGLYLKNLITSTMINMEKTIKELKLNQKKIKVIVGGAPVTKDFAKEIGADYRARDAVEGVTKISKWIKK